MGSQEWANAPRAVFLVTEEAGTERRRVSLTLRVSTPVFAPRIGGVAGHSYLPNPIARFCTQELKIKVIEKHVGDMPMMLGIRADEPRRAAKMPQHVLPLVADGITKSDVMAFWAKQPFDLRAEAGNCDLCFLKGSSELMGLIRKQPERAVWWAKQEEKIGGTFRSDRASYGEMFENAMNQTDMFGYEDPKIECFCGD